MIQWVGNLNPWVAMVMSWGVGVILIILVALVYDHFTYPRRKR